MRLFSWVLIAVCTVLILRHAFAHSVRVGVERALRARSWGTEVVQTDRPGCEASYTDDTRALNPKTRRKNISYRLRMSRDHVGRREQ